MFPNAVHPPVRPWSPRSQGFPRDRRLRPHGGPAPARRYERRRPEKTPLHEAVSEFLEGWLEDLAARERPVAGYVEDEFRGYLTCRPLCFGFARSWPAHRLKRIGRPMALRQATAERGDHEERPPGPIGLYAARSWRCRGASCPRSRPDLSRRRRPALKPLCSRAVRTVAWDPVRGCGCRSRAARLSVPERLPDNCGDWVEHCTALVEHVDGRIELVGMPGRVAHRQSRGRCEITAPASPEPATGRGCEIRPVGVSSS